MKYLCLVYLDAAHWSACPDSVCADYAQQLAGSQRLLAAEPLHATHTATTVRVRNGEVSVFDGPFAETREHLGGYYVLDVPDLDTAMRYAAQIPVAAFGTVEVRPLLNYDPANT